MPHAVELGYALSSEEHAPSDLVANARAAEEAGFGFALISDHYHPWVDAQGHSAFVWSVIGAIAQATERLRVGTGVTCPMIRIHPAIVAHAAATCACLMPGRFFLGVGTGENLNEHILGAKWPAPDERLEMLEEAVEVMRLLWRGGYQTHRGKHYTVENARIFDLPEEPVEVAVAAMQPLAAELAGRIGDAFVNVSPDPDLIERFDREGGEGKPKYGQITVCWAESKEEANRTAWECWPNAAIEGAASQELPLPEHFEQLAEMGNSQDLEGKLVLGPEPDAYLEQIRTFGEAGFTHVYLHQIGPDQAGFLEFARESILTRL
jgi:coenzyme F420-dependent glucose-6-phosphate dehydrogenase